MEQRNRRGNSFIVAIVAVVLIGLPVFYVLSIGPAVWLYHNAGFSEGVNDGIEAIYTPLILVCLRFEPLGEFLMAYIEWWE